MASLEDTKGPGPVLDALWDSALRRNRSKDAAGGYFLEKPLLTQFPPFIIAEMCEDSLNHIGNDGGCLVSSRLMAKSDINGVTINTSVRLKPYEAIPLLVLSLKPRPSQTILPSSIAIKSELLALDP